METTLRFRPMAQPSVWGAEGQRKPTLFDGFLHDASQGFVWDGDAYVLEVPVPGMSKSDLTLELNEGRLELRATKKEKKQGVEKSVSSLHAFQLPKEADPKTIDAKCENGLFTLRVGKLSAKQAKIIPVSEGSLPVKNRSTWWQRAAQTWKHWFRAK